MSKGIEKIEQKILTLDKLQSLVALWKKNGDRVVFTNGCFDVLHQGHVDYLIKSSDCGNRLVVAVNSDRSVKSLNKGVNRPINKEYSRAFIIASLFCVDAVVVFDETTPDKTIKNLLPNVLVKGADYDATVMNPNDSRYIVGSDIVRSKGGEIITIDLKEGFSSTSIINRIRERD